MMKMSSGFREATGAHFRTYAAVTLEELAVETGAVEEHITSEVLEAFSKLRHAIVCSATGWRPRCLEAEPVCYTLTADRIIHANSIRVDHALNCRNLSRICGILQYGIPADELHGPCAPGRGG